MAAGLAAFANSVARYGLPAALERAGLESLIGRPILEVLDGIIDHLGGPAASLDEVDARNALARLRAEMLDGVLSAEELEAVLGGLVTEDGLGDFVVRFFGCYLAEQFTRVFYERLVARIGNIRAAAFLNGIEEYIHTALREHHQTRDLRSIDWAGPDGQRIAETVLEETLSVFAGGG